MKGDILFEIKDGVAKATFNRPAFMNALVFDNWGELHDFVREIETRKDVGCLVLTGAGENFSAGGDVVEFSEMVANTAPGDLSRYIMDRVNTAGPLFMSLERIPQPVLASVRGVAAGGGFAFTVASDLCIASDTARFHVAQIKLGAVPDTALSFNLRRAVGIKKAKQLCFLGEPVDAEMGADLGFVNWVVPDAELEAETDKLARRLAAMPRTALGLTKRELNRSFHNTLADHFRDEAENVAACVQDPDYTAAVAAFIARRDAKRPRD